MVRRLIGIGAVFATLAGAGLVTAGAADAAYTDCPVGRACIWGDSQYQTGGNGASLLSFLYSYENFGRGTYPGTTRNGNDSASSVVNRGRGDYALFYYDNYCQVQVFTLQPNGERDPDLSNGISTNSLYKVGPEVNDNLTGAKFFGQVCNP
ncbi:hypothetical protein Cch01nite_15610 [Cellulomonas chitinilytica]|uniref:Peptidase inhibitor family I36 n=1 Tax=Cellulomonas chitinilytica TaxID=398759 RepID=A0A919P2A9_9CELL|nr:peptidase inhibitor family I36 protein [Cellulomonas chitinilytica]GIG20837.1 hypothetical protein Cch01nite_15610 [Cellulomonas chitinilytica]